MAGAPQLVLCDDGSLKTSKGCPANSPVEFIEHSYPQGTHVGTTPYTFTWTPPTTNAGTVHIYVAGSSVNNNLLADGGDHVYTNAYALTPSSQGPGNGIFFNARQRERLDEVVVSGRVG
jgi:hypothetical protein